MTLVYGLNPPWLLTGSSFREFLSEVKLLYSTRGIPVVPVQTGCCFCSWFQPSHSQAILMEPETFMPVSGCRSFGRHPQSRFTPTVATLSSTCCTSRPPPSSIPNPLTLVRPEVCLSDLPSGLRWADIVDLEFLCVLGLGTDTPCSYQCAVAATARPHLSMQTVQPLWRLIGPRSKAASSPSSAEIPF